MSERINRLFSRIYRKYDTMNYIYSFGVDVKWRKEAAKYAMIGKSHYKLLDIGTGTGDLAIAVADEAEKNEKNVEINGVDFNKNMLTIAKEKIRNKGLKNISLQQGDALSMRFKSNTFDVATSAFLLRNLDSVDKFADELHRVLKKGGKFAILEMATPDTKFQKFVYKLYFGILIRPIAYVISEESYKWLRYSIARFDKKGFVKILKSKGFKEINVTPVTLGVGFIVTGTK